jgi:glycosyltransferase involved in cell wall biosynthesis
MFGGSNGPNGSLLVFADDWGRHPSSCQHLIRQLLLRHPTCWVNTIGTRPPRLDRETLRRGFEKLREWTQPRRPLPNATEGIQVISPVMWPWLRSSLDRRVNRFLLTRRLRRAIARLPRPVVGVTTLPLVADLIGRLPIDRWVYYCVDDFSIWPGLDHEPIRKLEEELLERADVFIAVSEALRDKLARHRKPVHLLTHGVDLEHWQANGAAAPIVLEQLGRPLIVFWGVIDRRMDVEFLRRLDSALERGTILLAGPSVDPDPELDRLKRLVRIGPVAFDDLPALAREASVLVMPYADLPVTRAIQPLKLKEYLATGRPAVVRDLPAVQSWRDCMDVVREPDEFASAVLRRVETGLPTEQAVARQRLEDEGWPAKARGFESLCFDEAAAAESTHLETPNMGPVRWRRGAGHR